MASSVLIVDDDPAFLSLATRVLEGMGVDVVATAQSAVAAIEAANASKPDAALVDIGLRRGLEGLRVTQRNGWRAQRKVVVIGVAALRMLLRRQRY